MARNTQPGRNFNIDVKRLFLHLMDDSDVDNADPNPGALRAPDRQQQRNHPQDRLGYIRTVTLRTPQPSG